MREMQAYQAEIDSFTDSEIQDFGISVDCDGMKRRRDGGT
jgi:hypothetical protein